MTRRPRILFLQVNINPPGGGQSVAAWALEALKSDYDVTFLTWKPSHWDEINRYYGTQLHPSQFRSAHFPDWMRRLAALDPDMHSFLPLAFLLRAGRRMARGADLTIFFNDECDVGTRAIQYIHFPWLNKFYRDKKFFASASLAERAKYLVQVHYRPWRLLSGFQFEKMRQNLTLVNSDWTGQVYQASYEMPTRTLYPPVCVQPATVPWQERENGFVCIGRISPEKKYERIIEILGAVRERGHNIHLHVIGGMNENANYAEYYHEIRALIHANADWVSFHENIAREELTQLITTHRYGIHGMEDEHFGLAVAEMTRGGAIVFVPNDGGQVEIVGAEPRLLYASPQDAVEKISRVLENEHTQAALRAQLGACAAQFSAERFMGQLREIVAAELRRRV